ncbi:MAG: hypothetical protein QOF24_2916 [Verrucomicrobiota bacterium]|jgi:hypothetical protein
MAQIVLSANIVVTNGPKLAFNQTLEVDAYDKIDVIVPAPPDAAATDKKIELQPGGAGQVQFIAIVSDWFSDKLTYKINKKTADARALDQPHLLAGAGAVSLFDSAAPPATLFFTNASSGADAKPAKVQILIGRDATP